MEREGERLAKAVSGKEDARKLGEVGGEKEEERKKQSKQKCFSVFCTSHTLYHFTEVEVYIYTYTKILYPTGNLGFRDIFRY